MLCLIVEIYVIFKNSSNLCRNLQLDIQWYFDLIKWPETRTEMDDHLNDIWYDLFENPAFIWMLIFNVRRERDSNPEYRLSIKFDSIVRAFLLKIKGFQKCEFSSLFQNNLI